jgi:hypothetical protein
MTSSSLIDSIQRILVHFSMIQTEASLGYEFESNLLHSGVIDKRSHSSSVDHRRDWQWVINNDYAIWQFSSRWVGDSKRVRKNYIGGLKCFSMVVKVYFPSLSFHLIHGFDCLLVAFLGSLSRFPVRYVTESNVSLLLILFSCHLSYWCLFRKGLLISFSCAWELHSVSLVPGYFL